MPFSDLTTTASDELSRVEMDARRTVLRRIRRAGLNLALWQRSLPREVSAFGAAFIARRSPLELEVTAAPGPALLAALAAQSFFHAARHEPALHWLLDDLAELGTEFAAVTHGGDVRVRLSRVTDEACAVFHADTLPARLLCTYHGPGMQWVDAPDVCSAELGLRGRSIAAANAAIVPDPARIRTMSTGAVAIFKGRLWPGGTGRGLVHRSYPVCCPDHARLRLVIDPAGHAY